MTARKRRQDAADRLQGMVNQASDKLLRLTGPKRPLAGARDIEGQPVSLGTLTARQEVMAEAVATGRTGIDAYRIAFDCPTASDKTVGRKVSSLMGKPAFRAAVERHRARIRAEYERVFHRTARDITAALWREAENGENGGAVRVRALELLGRDRGMFSEKAQKTEAKTLSSEEVEQQIRGMLETYLGGNALIINDLDKG